MLRVGIMLLTGWLLAGAALAGEAGQRFSQTLSPAERTACGIGGLDSDQTAILDALVRRDIFEREPAGPAAPKATVFSGRLSADELKNAGVAAMSTEQRQQLDAAVARYQSGSSIRTLLAPPIFLRHGSAARVTEKKKEREIHGSMSLSYGWGGGYSTRTGALVMNMTDPDKKYSVTIGYAETHVKGPAGPSIYLAPGQRFPGDPILSRP